MTDLQKSSLLGKNTNRGIKEPVRIKTQETRLRLVDATDSETIPRHVFGFKSRYHLTEIIFKNLLALKPLQCQRLAPRGWH